MCCRSVRASRPASRASLALAASCVSSTTPRPWSAKCARSHAHAPRLAPPHRSASPRPCAHTTQTRATDPEILEQRYPLILRAATLRSGSAGAGAFHGGEGVRRELEFRRPLTVSILSERRALRPYGMAGGGAGACGVNTLFRRGGAAGVGRAVNLGGKATVDVAAGDILRIETPGGGGSGVSV